MITRKRDSAISEPMSIQELIEKEAEIDANPEQALSLEQLDSHIQSQRG